MINEYVSLLPERCIAIPSLGLRRYLSALRYVSAVVGNSSSGIIEVPSFGIPTLDIGDRQKGRIAAESVWHCDNDTLSIVKSLEKILSEEFCMQAKCAINPYERENTTENICQIISDFPLEELNQKRFYDFK